MARPTRPTSTTSAYWLDRPLVEDDMRVSLIRRWRPATTAAIALAAIFAVPTAAMAQPPLAACDDLLVTITPTGTTGDVLAAAVTAQALVADQPGWESVTWAVADDIDLRDVLVLDANGGTRSIGAQRSGSSDAVLALGFCGTTAPGEDGHVDDPAPRDDDTTSTSSAEPAQQPAPAPAPEPDPAPARAENATGDSSNAVVEVAADEGGDDETSAGESASGNAPDPTAIGTVGPGTAAYHDAARVAQALATPPPGTDELVPGTILLAASATPLAAGPAGAPAPQRTGSAALLGLLAGAVAGLAVLGMRRRLQQEVDA